MRLYRYRRIIALAGIIGVASVGIGAAYQDHKPAAIVQHIYTVEAGDTLWSIAGKYSDESKDIREVVYQIRTDNDITNGHLSPGQQLVIKKELPSVGAPSNSVK